METEPIKEKPIFSTQNIQNMSVLSIGLVSLLSCLYYAAASGVTRRGLII
jgi:hypothetical protein